MFGNKAEHQRQFLVEPLGVAANFRLDNEILQIKAIAIVKSRCGNRNSQEDRLVFLQIGEDDMLASKRHAVFRQFLRRVLFNSRIKDAGAERNVRWEVRDHQWLIVAKLA